MSKKALLIVDVQKDFCPGGKLPVKDCSKIVKNINTYIDKFKLNELPIIVSRDWHPPNSKHFKDFGGRWPKHCVQNTEGAEFHPELHLPENAVIISKGTTESEDSYSAFEGRNEQGKLLVDVLRHLGVLRLYVCGLATDYCVKSSALDAINAGFKVYLLVDAIEGVDVKEQDSKRAIAQMQQGGVINKSLEDIDL